MTGQEVLSDLSVFLRVIKIYFSNAFATTIGTHLKPNKLNSHAEQWFKSNENSSITNCLNKLGKFVKPFEFRRYCFCIEPIPDLRSYKAN